MNSTLVVDLVVESGSSNWYSESKNSYLICGHFVNVQNSEREGAASFFCMSSCILPKECTVVLSHNFNVESILNDVYLPRAKKYERKMARKSNFSMFERKSFVCIKSRS